MIADVFEAQLPAGAPVNLATGDGVDVAGTLEALDLRSGVEVFVFDPAGTLVGPYRGQPRRQRRGPKRRTHTSSPTG